MNDTINWRVRGPLPIATAIDDRPIFSVATVVTLADVAAQNPSLETLAVLFRTTRPLAVTPFGVSPTVLTDFGFESMRVAGQRGPNGLQPHRGEVGVVVAILAVAVFLAFYIGRKAFAVQFQTLGLLAVALGSGHLVR